MQNTTLCYLEKDGAYLMLHRCRKKEDINAGKWVGIGGHFEEGESPYDCVIREVFEETGLVLGAARYRGIITFVTDRGESEQMHLFTSDVFYGKQVSCDEGDAEWVDRERVALLPLWEGDLIFFRLLRENRPFFSLKLVYQGDRLASAVLDGVPLSGVGEGRP